MFSWMGGSDSNAEAAEEVPTQHATRIPPQSIDDVKDKYAANLAKVKLLLKEDLQKPENHLYDDDMWILRFLFNPKYSAEQCADRYRKMIRLREADGINKIREEILAGGDNYDVQNFPFFEPVNRAFPESLWHTSDVFGNPVAVQLLGKADPKHLVSSVTKEQFFEYTKYKAEYIRLTLDRLSSEHGVMLQWVQLLDLDGMGMKHMNSTAMDYVKSASSRVDQMYKECLGKIYVVNAPRVFHMIWGMMKLWVTERTAQKLTLMGSSHKEELPEIIPKGLPHFLGGEQHAGKVAYVEFNNNLA